MEGVDGMLVMCVRLDCRSHVVFLGWKYTRKWKDSTADLFFWDGMVFFMRGTRSSARSLLEWKGIFQPGRPSWVSQKGGCCDGLVV